MTKNHARLTHPHTGARIVPLGFRRNGAPIWPILGASEDDGDGDGDGDDPDAGDDAAGAGEGDGDRDGEAAPEALGDAGKQALDRMKSERNEARRENRRLKAELEAATTPKAPDGDAPDPEALKAEGRREAIAEANQRVIRSEVKAAAVTAQFNDPADALQYIDLTQFEVDDDGNVDPEEIADAISDLLSKKPYLAAQGGKRFQGSADGGTRNGTKPPTLDEQIAAATAEGRVRDVISLQNQRLSEVAGKS